MHKVFTFQALSICLFLIFAPTCMIIILWNHFNMGTWLLAVTAFCIEVLAYFAFFMGQTEPKKLRLVRVTKKILLMFTF